MTERLLMTTDGVGGRFYWRFCAEDDHITAAVNALCDVARGDGDRVWRPIPLAMAKREFRIRLELATQGKLREPQQVKGVRRGTEVRLGEMRWSAITVPEVRDGHDRGVQVQVRLYYAEPDGYGRVILGLHCHEKRTDGTESEVRVWQDEEIDKALNCYADGAPSHWGVDLDGPGVVQPRLDI
jgi:ribosomal protein S10